MSYATGIGRLKTVWLAICWIPAIAIVGILAFSEYRPDLMKQFSLLTLLIAGSLSLPVLLDITLKSRIAVVIIGAGGGAAIFANLNASQDALRGEMKPAAFLLFGVGLWISWTVIEWIVKGFVKKG